MLNNRLLIAVFVLYLSSCVSSHTLLNDAVKELDGKYQIELTTTPHIETASIVFLDASSLLPSKPEDFKEYYKPNNEDIGWIGRLISSSQQGDFRMMNLKKSILQYAGYKTKEGQIKIIVGVLSQKYFKLHKAWCLQKHVYYDLVVNTDGQSKYQLYALIFNKPQGDFKIELIKK